MPVRQRLFAIALTSVLMVSAGCDKETTEQKLAIAEQHLAERHFATAIVNLKGILQEEPDNLEALKLIGVAYHQVGSYSEATQKLRKVVGSPHIDGFTTLIYCDALIKQERFQLAKETLQSVQVSEEHAEEYVALLAEASLGLGEFAGAEKLVTEALEESPESARLMLALSRIYFAQDKRFLSINEARKAIAAQPYDHQLYGHLGTILLDEKMFSEAVDSFQRALTANQVDSPTEEVIATNINLLRAYLATNDAENAQQILTTIKQQSPDHPAIDYFSALLFLNENKLSDALTSALKTLSKVDRHPPTELLVGVISYRLNKLEQANMYLERFLSTEPDRVVARKLLASTQLKLNNPAAAEETLRSGLKRAPDDLSLSELIDEIREVSAQARDPGSGELIFNEENQSRLQEMIEKLENRELSELAARVRAIKQLAEEGAHDDAYTRITRLIAEHPGRGEIYEFAGAIAVLANRPVDAEAFWTEAIRLMPDSTSSAINLANHYLRQHDPDKAAELFELLLADYPGRVGILIGLAHIEEQRGDIARSLIYLRQATESQPQLLAPRQWLIRLLRNHNYEKEAAEELEKALAIFPNSAELRILHAQQLIVDGYIELATEALEAVLAETPENVDALLSYSIALASLDSPERALDPLMKARDLAPESFKIASRLALLTADQKGTEAGLAIINHYRKRTEDNFGAEVMTGHLWSHVKEYAKAAAHYGRARLLNPRERLLLMEVAATSKAGNSDRAIELTEEWLNEYPDHKKTRFELATLQLYTNRYLDSAKHFQRLIDEGGQLPAVYNNLAWLYQQLNDDRAEVVAELGITRFPDDPLLMDTYGWILVEARHKMDLAEQLLSDAYAETHIPEIGYHLAVALDQNGRPTRARSVLKRILSGDENFGSRRAAQTLLNKLQQ